MAQADGLNNTSTRWWTYAPALVWIIQRIELPLEDAERIVNSFELYPEIEPALNRLKGKLYKELYEGFVLGMARSWPAVKFRILDGGRYVDLLTKYKPLPGAELSAQREMIRDFVENVVRWPDVEFSSDWLKQAFPATAPAPKTSAPMANAEAPVVKPEAASPPPANATITEAATSPSKSPSEPPSELPSEPRSLNSDLVDPTIAHALTKQLSGRRQPIGRVLPFELTLEPATSAASPAAGAPVMASSAATPAASVPAQSASQAQSETPLPATQPNERTVADSAPGDSELAAVKKRVKQRLKKRVRRRGPDRYSKSDRALFPKMTSLMKEKHLSVEEAAGQLSVLGKIEGRGTPASRKHRLAKRYRKRGKSKTP